MVSNDSNPFTFNVSNSVTDESIIKLMLTLSNDSGYVSTGYLELEVAGKNLYAYSIDVTGSSQDVLSSGQTSNVHIELHNIGSTTAQNITGVITSASQAIEIIDNTASWSSIYPNSFGSSSNSGDSFVIEAKEDIILSLIHI